MRVLVWVVQMAQVFAAEGASIAAVDLRAETAEETVQGLQNTDGAAIAIEADVSDASSVDAMVKAGTSGV